MRVDGGEIAPLDGRDRKLLRRLADARLAAEAARGLADGRPDLSIASGMSAGQRVGARSFLGALTVALLMAPDALAPVVFATCTVLFSVLIALRLAAAMMTLQSQPVRPSPLADEDLPPLTYLVPLYHEANVVADLVEALFRIDYPVDRLEVLMLVEHDDDETIDALRALRLPDWFDIIPAPPSEPRTKPKALNYGLARARGEIVAVLDAEDSPHPRQAREAAAALAADRRLAVVQAPLLAHNAGDSWIASQFGVEYAIHFRVWLPFLARMGWPLALGGTSNYFRRDRLEAAGGWDAWNVTEDADIGFRLARRGDGAATITLPTHEEAPVRWRDWLAQRTRWMKGHIQTWLVLTRDPAAAIAQMGLARFLGAALTLGGSLVASMMHGPILIWLIFAMLTPLPDPSGWDAALLGVGYGSALVAAFAAGPEGRRPIALITFPLYWPLLSAAMALALIEMKSRPHAWAKTPHGVSRRRRPMATKRAIRRTMSPP
jgi:cellulose synthase/poly-beta-1,6-N-acetylglucosamine synthase-like glycosyltransferase